MTETATRPSVRQSGTSATGIVAMIIPMALLPIGDAFAKFLTGEIHPVEVATGRFVVQLVLLFAAAALLRRRLEGPMFSPLVAVSGGLVMVTLTMLISAFAVMPIATAIAIFFVEPLLLTVLAGPLLGERLGARRLSAVGVGLVGALIVIRPGGELGWAAVMPLIAALTYALNMIVLRRASATRSSLTLQCGATFYAALGSLAITALLYATGFVVPRIGALPGWGWGALIAAGAFAACSFLLIAEAFRRVEAGILAPLQYFEIIGATVVGYLAFGEFPDALTWAGLAVILASGLYVFYRERRLAVVPRRSRRRVPPR
ncbi:DMT family transporter [Roseicyclus sp. F158]|uniref:DMT family transporter n=1 Tax=Tropicimonas omnivorans TaxID=3075590 RepID=A0ABU3DKW4_9RHOB|nr:DMT family transporter [Roseicyclus sp. F158]MDT0684364.1 DMT family transporter [Roseicyclus sp. F158]